MESAQQDLFAPRYSEVSEEKTSGATYTPKILADFVARQIVGAMPDLPKDETIDVLDPAAGDGELLIAVATELKACGYSRIVLHGFETNKAALAEAASRIRDAHPDVDVNLEIGDFLKFVLDSSADSLLASRLPRKYHAVIANPPYVRTQILGAKEAKRLAALFDLKGRVDLYYPFVLGIGMVLRERGVAGVITSNRYMTTKGGASVRSAIRRNFDVLGVWDLGDTKLFDAAVLPAVLLAAAPGSGLSGGRVGFASIYETKELADTTVADPIQAIAVGGIVGVSDGRRFEVKIGVLDDGRDPEGVWRISTDSGDDWLRTVSKNTWGTFETVGKIRVGVKSTADEVFVNPNWDAMPESERPELLRPLITHHVARQFKPIDGGKRRWILYTHESVQGKRRAIDLEAHPKSKAFLEKHRERLTSRSYVIKAKRRWYEVWVPQDPAAWSRPKLILRDISEEPCFWIDLDGSVVQGDCYWMIAPDGKDDLLWLAAGVGNSKFIEEFYDHKFNNKLYSGRRRFMTQYVAEFPLPDPSSEIAKRIVATAKLIYEATPSEKAVELFKELDGLVRKAFGVAVPVAA